MAINTYLSTIESKKQTKQTRTETASWIQRTFSWLPDGRGCGEWVKRGGDSAVQIGSYRIALGMESTVQEMEKPKSLYA